jgi:hypothetical protein
VGINFCTYYTHIIFYIKKKQTNLVLILGSKADFGSVSHKYIPDIEIDIV